MTKSLQATLMISHKSIQIAKQKSLAWLLLFLSLTLVQSCGFKLRGSQALPSEIQDVYITADYIYAPLQRALDQRLPVYQLQSNIIERQDLRLNEITNSVVISLQPEQLERRLLSIFSTGQVAEYELMYSIDYEVRFSGKDPIRSNVTVAREYQDDPDEVLAKSRELELVLQEMRLDAADRIIRLLSSQYSQSQLLNSEDEN
jgi:LPS-assembly lipoprotein